MAKRLSRRKMEIEIDDVNGTYKMTRCFYMIDDGDANTVRTDVTGPNPCPEKAIEAADLSGTMQAFFDTNKTDIEAQESI